MLASPQRRARETAAPIAAALGVPVEIDADLAEVWVGHWQGQTAATLRDNADVQRYFADPTHVCAAIEPIGEVCARMLAATERLTSRAGDRPVCLVSHGDPLRALLGAWLGLEPGGFRRLHVAPGSISIGRAGLIDVLNWTPELPAAGGG